nr:MULTISPECIES: metallophosphoesterase [unclassified Paenibacillus]
MTFAVLSDIHLQRWDQRSIHIFGRALDDLHHAAPLAEALIINGDLGNGNPGDYRALRQMLDKHPHPRQVYYTIGNHEFYRMWHDRRGRWSPGTFPNGETDTAAIQRFLRFVGEPKVYYERQIEGYRFLLLGTERYRQSDPSVGEDAYLSASQLQWLKAKLKEAAPERKPVFVFLHQPLPDTVSGSGREGCGRGVVQYQQLKALLSSYPQTILFSGHSHRELEQPRTIVHDGFMMANSSSVRQPWKEGGPYTPEAAKSEGLIVEVYPDRVLIRGRDFGNRIWVTEGSLRFNEKTIRTLPEGPDGSKS